ncbi:hypothetical protein Scep_026832 [Stephania cephalantha]|uniref:Uncharacterized protein n=1 Tax=Stephania cephalantha TaxID=152367 RepID=A0AAP0ET57_9MAGN
MDKESRERGIRRKGEEEEEKGRTGKERKDHNHGICHAGSIFGTIPNVVFSIWTPQLLWSGKAGSRILISV